jgi:transposase InsO family protein
LAISHQNKRSTSRRSAGAPGDFIGDLPVNAFIHPAGRPIDASTSEVLRRPVEFTQYTSDEFRGFCRDNGVRPSVGRTGSCFDNAVAESFFATIKKELVHVRPWPSIDTLRNAVFEYIESYYNRRRRHSTIGYDTPIEYEKKYALTRLQAA